jgi:hemerythrin-like metal-binding protein
MAYSLGGGFSPQYAQSIMKPPAWHERYVSGVERIDAQHQEIFTLIHELGEAAALGTNKAEVGHFLDAFREHIVVHFAEEEQAMRQQGYPDLPHHSESHVSISDQLAQLVIAQNNGEVVAASSVIAMGNLLIRHIQTDDLKMATWMRERGAA